MKLCAMGAGARCLSQIPGPGDKSWAQSARKGLIKTRLSPYYTPLPGGAVQCELCPRRCRLSEGERGFCRVRENRGGKCYSLVHGNPCVIHLSPIEKEPFFHILPGTRALTLSTAGCNFRCKFCENWEISQAFPEDVYSHDVPPETVVKKAGAAGARSILYTYAEPTIFYEYLMDVAGIARKAGLLNIIHSNGYINPEPLRELCKVLDGAQIDLKGFDQAFYDELCGGELNPVLETLKTLKQEKIHMEIGHIIIPTKNDDMRVLKEMCLWVKETLGPDTPLHLSRFYPLHKLQRLPPTPVSTLEKARAIALEAGLEYAYIGRVPGHEGWHTYCPACRRKIIERTGYMIRSVRVKEGACGYCGKPIPGIWT
ncbi:MAG: AmmeMemoRadiSam system radical SAM enzyme [Pseudomonadota bacterium]